MTRPFLYTAAGLQWFVGVTVCCLIVSVTRTTSTATTSSYCHAAFSETPLSSFPQRLRAARVRPAAGYGWWGNAVVPVHTPTPFLYAPFVLRLAAPGAAGGREAEIRRTMARLKRQGRLQRGGDNKNNNNTNTDTDTGGDNNDDADYSNKIQQKLGSSKSKLLGFTNSSTTSGDGDSSDTYPDERLNDELDVLEQKLLLPPQIRQAAIGALVQHQAEEEQESPQVELADYLPVDLNDIVPDEPTYIVTRTPLIDSSLFDSNNDDDDDNDDDAYDLAATLMDEIELIDLVAQKMAEKQRQQQDEQQEQAVIRLTAQQQTAAAGQSLTTSGIGGSWAENKTAVDEMYQPKSGSWGAFPRPKDISKAYGGGRRVGSGYSDEASKVQSADETRARLQQYREKAGIDVQSERDHAAEIEEALNIASLAMQRGIYSTAVSALEKVTVWCSSNSRVGGKVFLELAMAYEAAGKTEEAIAVYGTLTRCRIESIRHNAKRLLYGLEAMQFMQNDLKSSEFSRKKARNTFIDTTGFGDITSNFDDVYQTAYVDLENGFYKRLTKSVVRSSREARQILLRAVGAGEIDRLRVVQALRSLSRAFEDALESEITLNAPVLEPVAIMNGKPILAERSTAVAAATATDQTEFVLMNAEQMQENINGEWRLQLLADRRGDGVKYFDGSVSWQQVDMDLLTFDSANPVGFVTVQQAGKVVFNDKRRILRRRSVEVSGGGVLSGLFGKQVGGATSAVRFPQQVMTVDSILLVTRGVPSKRVANKVDDKDYFAVWRRVEPGTYSRKSR